jgi:hypothetical protein
LFHKLKNALATRLRVELAAARPSKCHSSLAALNDDAPAQISIALTTKLLTLSDSRSPGFDRSGATMGVTHTPQFHRAGVNHSYGRRIGGMFVFIVLVPVMHSFARAVRC